MSTNNKKDTSQTSKIPANSESNTENNESIASNGYINETKTDDQTPKQQEAGKLRTKVVDELLQTEKTYVKCLDNLIRHFMKPLQRKINGKILLSSTEHQTIFPSDINTIYGFHSQLLIELCKVHTNWNNNTSKIGNIFVKYGQLFKMYQNYMNNHEKAASCVSTLKDKNTKFTEWCINTRQKCNNCTLDSLLILPIQRIPRYRLLLKELIKRTEEFDINHTDLSNLRNALELVTGVTSLINDRMKENDRRQKVAVIETRFDRSLIDKMGTNLVTPARYFIAESSEYIIKHNKHGSRSHIVLFVFNDCLIYGHYENNTIETKRNFLLLGSDLLKFDHLISFDAMFRLEDVPMQPYKNLYCCKIFGSEHSLWISFQTIQSKFKWMTLLLQTNEKANIIIKTIRSVIKYKYDIDIPYPLFIPDDFSDKCLRCKGKFSLINRRHHCYYCGTLACSKCTEYRLKSAWKKNEIVRVCNRCHDKYKDESGDVPPITLPSHHRASVWEASDGYNLNNYESKINIVPILSPSASPIVKGLQVVSATPPPVFNINNELESKRRNSKLFDIDALMDTPAQTPKVVVQEEVKTSELESDEKLNNCFKYETENDEIGNGDIELKDEEELETGLIVNDLDEDEDVDNENKIDFVDEDEKDMIKDIDLKVNDINEIDKNCNVSNDMNDEDMLVIDDNLNNLTRDILIIGGIVVVGIAIFGALKRTRFYM